VITKEKFKKDLEKLFSDFKWNVCGVIDINGNIIPLPKDSKVITMIFEELGWLRIQKLVKDYECTCVRGGSRQYPDVTLEGGKLGDKIIAVEFKSARKLGKNKCSRMSLGSFAGYFLEPYKKSPWCVKPYGVYSEHWVVGFLYSWNPDKDSLNMVSDVEVIVQEKWRIASKYTATGDTAHIGSVDDIERLKKGKGDFKSEEEFESYWREKGRKYIRRKTH
jgi:hypothetical protein